MATKTYSPRLADKYKKEVVPALVKKFGYKCGNASSKIGKDLSEPWCQWRRN